LVAAGQPAYPAGARLIEEMAEAVRGEGITALAAQVSGVVARLKAQEALRRREERFRLLYEHAPVAYPSLHEAGRVLLVNQTWLETLGHSRGELPALRVPDIDPAFTAEWWAAHWDELHRSGSVAFESLHRHRAGRGRRVTRKVGPPSSSRGPSIPWTMRRLEAFGPRPGRRAPRRPAARRTGRSCPRRAGPRADERG